MDIITDVTMKGEDCVLEITTHSAEATKDTGFKLGRLLKPGDIVCLEGNLGVGKTLFVQGIALGLGVVDYVTSPTFNIIHEYNGRIPLYHMDVYRLNSVEEMEDLGYDEYFYGKGVVVIEWAEKIQQIIPEERLWIKGETIGENTRRFVFKPSGERYKTLIKELKML